MTDWSAKVSMQSVPLILLRWLNGRIQRSHADYSDVVYDSDKPPAPINMLGMHVNEAEEK